MVHLLLDFGQSANLLGIRDMIGLMVLLVEWVGVGGFAGLEVV